MASQLNAQPGFNEDYLFPDNSSRAKHFYLVPEVGLWFGTYTNVELAPLLGYYVTDRWSVGLGPHYVFYNNPGYLNTDLNSTHIFGARVFTRLSIIRNAAEILPFYLFDELFAHFEYEKMSLNAQYFNYPTTEQRVFVDYMYVGAGLSQELSARSSYFFMLLWNLYDSHYSLYRNPTYRVGVNITF